MRTVRAAGVSIVHRFDEPEGHDALLSMIMALTEESFQRRQRLMAELHSAVEDNDTTRVIAVCRELCGKGEGSQ